jgi:hypothetical protein
VVFLRGGVFLVATSLKYFLFWKIKSLHFSFHVAHKCDGILNFVLLSYLGAKLYYGLISSLAISQIQKKKKGRKASGVHAVVHPLEGFFLGAMKCAQLWGNCKVMNSNYIKLVGGHKFSYSNHIVTDSENWVFMTKHNRRLSCG